MLHTSPHSLSIGNSIFFCSTVVQLYKVHRAPVYKLTSVWWHFIHIRILLLPNYRTANQSKRIPLGVRSVDGQSYGVHQWLSMAFLETLGSFRDANKSGNSARWRWCQSPVPPGRQQPQNSLELTRCVSLKYTFLSYKVQSLRCITLLLSLRGQLEAELPVSYPHLTDQKETKWTRLKATTS